MRRALDDLIHLQRHKKISGTCSIKECLEMNKDECKECVSNKYDAARGEKK